MAWCHVLTASAVLAFGCDSQGDSMDANTGTPSSLSVTVYWTLKNAAGVYQPCPAGFGTTEVLALPVFSGGARVPIGDFPCADGSGTVTASLFEHLAPDIMVRITDGPGGHVFGESEPTGAAVAVSVAVITDLGRLKVHWTLSQGGVNKTCNDLGIDTVQVEATPAQGQTIRQSTPCINYYTTTGLLPTGTARVVVTAGAKSGSLDNVAVPMGSLSTDVTPIDLAF